MTISDTYLEIGLLVLLLQAWLGGFVCSAMALFVNDLTKMLPMDERITVTTYFLMLFSIAIAVHSLVPLAFTMSWRVYQVPLSPFACARSMRNVCGGLVYI